MATQTLVEIVSALSPEEQAAVREFVDFLKGRSRSPFLTAVDEFISEHPDLLRRLAQ